MTHRGTGTLIWITGLSAAGKTTIAHALCKRLCEMGVAIKWLDGDRVRREENCDLGYSREDRDENVRRIGAAALRSIREGYTVVVSAMSPFRQTRDEIRRTVPGFVEVCMLPLRWTSVRRRDKKEPLSASPAGRDLPGRRCPASIFLTKLPCSRKSNAEAICNRLTPALAKSWHT